MGGFSRIDPLKLTRRRAGAGAMTATVPPDPGVTAFEASETAAPNEPIFDAQDRLAEVIAAEAVVSSVRRETPDPAVWACGVHRAGTQSVETGDLQSAPVVRPGDFNPTMSLLTTTIACGGAAAAAPNEPILHRKGR
jgi:hypothetical protein